jgi:hypothetical protein
MRNEYKYFVRKPEGQKALGRPKVTLKGAGCRVGSGFF